MKEGDGEQNLAIRNRTCFCVCIFFDKIFGVLAEKNQLFRRY
jgi:hypothetical protein